MHLKQPASPTSCLLFVAPLPAFSGVVLPWLVSLVFSPADVFLLPSHRALFFACKHSQSSLPSIDNIIILLLSSSCMCSFSVLDSLTLPPQCLLVSLSLLSHSLSGSLPCLFSGSPFYLLVSPLFFLATSFSFCFWLVICLLALISYQPLILHSS